MAGPPPGCRLVAFEMVALRIWVKVGLIPQAKQGGRVVCSLAVVGSKLDGTGLEKLQMVHTHVAELAGGVSTGGARKGLSTRCAGEAFPLRNGWRDARLLALGTKVILGDDLRNPAYITC